MKKYLYMLGKKYLLIIGFLLFILPSCKDDILNEVPLDFLSPDNAYLTEKGVIQGISGLHERVRGAYYAMNEFGTMNWAAHGSDLGYNGEVPQAGSGYLNSYLDLNPTFKADTPTRSIATSAARSTGKNSRMPAPRRTAGAADLAGVRYEGGVTSYLEVLYNEQQPLTPNWPSPRRAATKS